MFTRSNLAKNSSCGSAAGLGYITPGSILGRVSRGDCTKTEFLCTLVYSHEYTRRTENVIWTMESEVEVDREQLVYIQCVSIDGG